MTPARIAAALDDMPVPSLLVAGDGKTVLWTNQAAKEHFAISDRRLLATPLPALLPGVDGLGDKVRQAVAGAETFVLRNMDVGRFRAEVGVYPSGGDAGVVITPNRTANSRAQQGRPIQALGQMIGHELKNPLAGIKGAAQLLRDDLQTPESASLIDLIVSEIDRIKRLTERLETFGDTELADPTRVNVHTLLRNARKVMAVSGTTLFEEDYDPSLPHIEGDADQLMQVLVNLIKNAIEAMDGAAKNGADPADGEPAHNKLVLRTRSRQGMRRDNRNLPVEIQIIDSGPGLPAAMRERIFEPFVTSKPNGQGLGLALVAKTVAAHGGLVEVDSRPGRTCFSLLLPAAIQTPREAAHVL